MSFRADQRMLIPGAATDPTSSTAYDLTAIVPVGTVANTNDGKQFLYVKASSDLSAVAAKAPVKISSAYVITASGSGGPAFGPQPAWAVADCSTTNRYGWLQVGGIASCTTDTNVAAADMIAWAASGSSQFVELAGVNEGGAANLDEKAVVARGIALEDDSSSTGNILLFPIFPTGASV